MCQRAHNSFMAKQTATDYARQALQKMGGDAEKAITLLVGWMQHESEVRAALGNIDRNATQELRKRAREAVHKAQRQDLERSGPDRKPLA